VDRRLSYPARPEDFAKATREMVNRGVRLMGGCCGTTPNHIAAIAAATVNL
jgi:methionine synthase / methylenetetrahydrofolate reductase (NADH)